MRCFRCGAHMDKDPDTRVAICPECGRTCHYRTNGDRNRDRDLLLLSMYDSNKFRWFLEDFLMNLLRYGIPILLVGLAFLIFGVDVFKGIWAVIRFLLTSLWNYILIPLLKLIWSLLTDLWHLIFG